MDLSNRGGRPVSMEHMANQAPAAHQPVQSRGKKRGGVPFGRLASVFILFSVAIILAAVIALFVFGGGKAEEDLIKSDKYQAIFLNDANGQVYFGRLTIVNEDLYKLSDIFYVRVQQVQPEEGETENQQNISLAKLGNELHGPEDVMYISRDKVLFWENLKDDGQVVEAIVKYKENPEAATQNNSGTNNQNQ